MLLSEAIEQFIAAHRHQWAQRTTYWYQRRLMSLTNYLGDIQVETITAQNLRDWMYWQVAEKSYSDNTRAGNHLAATLMFRWLNKNGLIDENHFENPGNQLDRPKIREQVQPKAKHDVVFNLLKFIEDELGEMPTASRQYIIARRDLAMFWLMISTGCRRVELTRLQMKDFEIEMVSGQRMGVIRFIGKGFLQRRNYIAHEALIALEEWLAVRPEPATQAIFVSTSRNESGKYARFWTSHINRQITIWAKKAGLEEETLTPHSFRRAYATYAASQNVPITLIQKQLGHASITTTMEYIKHDDAGLLGESQRIIGLLKNQWEEKNSKNRTTKEI